MYDGGVIDAHVHIGRVYENKPPLGVDDMVAWMDRRGIDKAVLLPLESPEATSHYVTTGDVLDIAEARSDRFVPFCTVDPRMSMVTGRDGFDQRIAEAVERGARGFGELKVGLNVNHERLRTLYSLCGDHDLPVLFHMDDRRCTDDVGLPNFETVLEDFPGVDFIAHAQGWWAHVSEDVTQMTGYPEGPIVRGGRCGELLREYDNCYADISARSGWNALTRDLEFGQEFLERHDDKLLFGTDRIYAEQRLPQLSSFETFDLSRRQWKKICHDNVVELLR
jgi:predicted TIM-barrel fold metal-dependent hydrolase